MFSQPDLYRQERGLTVKLDESKSSGFPIRSKLDTISSASFSFNGIDANRTDSTPCTGPASENTRASCSSDVSLFHQSGVLSPPMERILPCCIL